MTLSEPRNGLPYLNRMRRLLSNKVPSRCNRQNAEIAFKQLSLLVPIVVFQL
ncbi:hypothetical protein A79_0666 [Vibrio parahaemolyticus AQ3810]|nr:hypothetical protein A79_0666 [Vibrio parahaemolyticus AQ3810]EQM00115.1 hypothetical protein D040_0507 [Vibrio parahaemolyticus NIHCB0603]EQM46010.1 hypothetical protein D025_1064 [Vibrio parahaemolyticus 949]EVU18023.1 hypothetical protein D046_2557 [Vibrio parahaemolyticus V-223/04]EXJ48962.1 hypothetical protein D049_0121 [Vibrio parahaemolyticus VPTS-2010]